MKRHSIFSSSNRKVSTTPKACYAVPRCFLFFRATHKNHTAAAGPRMISVLPRSPETKNAPAQIPHLAPSPTTTQVAVTATSSLPPARDYTKACQLWLGGPLVQVCQRPGVNITLVNSAAATESDQQQTQHPDSRGVSDGRGCFPVFLRSRRGARCADSKGNAGPFFVRPQLENRKKSKHTHTLS